MELYYRRAESVRKGRTVPARTQTVVIFLPDVRSCLPTRVEWDELNMKYKNFAEIKRQSSDGDGEKKLKHAKTDEPAHDESVGEVEMADEAEMEQTTSAGKTDECGENVDASETKAATDCESSLATSTAAISKALLNIISNFT